MSNRLEVYSVPEAAEILHVSKTTLHKWINTGKLRASKPGRRWLITRDALDELLEQGEKR